MKIIKSKDKIGKFNYPIITIGNFDGVHLAHQEIIKKAVKRAKEKKGTSIVITFEPHPVKFFKHFNLKLLQTINQRLEIIESLGIDVVIVLDFNENLSNTSAKTFVEEFLIDKIGMKEIFIGYNFHFGKNKEGDIDLIENLSKKHSFEVFIQNPIILDGIVCSSTNIRKFIEAGEIEKANFFLNRNFSISGIVVGGNKLGEKIGFPTINIKSENELLPLDGVYITYVNFKEDSLPSITNIGIKPTFGETMKSIESHILNFNKEIYGEKVNLCFLKRIRSEIKFPSVKELSEQIARDIEIARNYFYKDEK